MPESIIVEVPFIDSILHPTDCSAAALPAFLHGLAIALLRQCEFTILHVNDARRQDTAQFPAVRATLERWGRLVPGSSRSQLSEQLALQVNKVGMKGHDPLHTILQYLEQHPVDLIVLSTAGRTGLPRWLHPSVAERIAERSATRTLFVPEDCRGFVSSDDGTPRIRRILVPVDQTPSPLSAIEYSARIARLMASPVDILLLSVGTGMPSLPEIPALAGVSWCSLQRTGDVVAEVLAVAREQQVDLIAMTTAGSTGILDALRGSITRQVLRQAPCPVFAIPELAG